MNIINYLKSRLHRNSKLLYYLAGFTRCCTPSFLLKMKLDAILDSAKHYDTESIFDRVNYYNKLADSEWDFDTMRFMNAATPLSEFVYPKRKRFKSAGHVYFFDTHQYVRLFPRHLRAAYVFGDVTSVPDLPSIVKSRPINGDNANSIVLNLEKVRHFLFLKDRKPFTAKMDKLIGRGAIHQPHRIKFFERYFGHPLCDLGQINKSEKHPEWMVPKMPIIDHLNYKFILCLEGFDVASNLKWVMSSNSLAVMPRPTYETWFMEGRLVPNHHYVEIKPDYSDLEERLNYYTEHPDEAVKITENAHKYISQFMDRRKEDLVSALVLKKYFERTGQM